MAHERDLMAVKVAWKNHRVSWKLVTQYFEIFLWKNQTLMSYALLRIWLTLRSWKYWKTEMLIQICYKPYYEYWLSLHLFYMHSFIGLAPLKWGKSAVVDNILTLIEPKVIRVLIDPEEKLSCEKKTMFE